MTSSESPLARFLQNAFTANLGLKAIALTFSLFLFAYIHGQRSIQQRTVPVGVISLPPEFDDLELMTRIPPSIHVTLRGSSRALDQLIQAGVNPVEIDLRSGPKRSVQFTRELFKLPPEVEIVFVDPPSIDLEWEKVVTETIALRTSITGKPMEGYMVKEPPTVEPRQITVKGPVSSVEVLQFARLAPFDVTGLTEGVWPRRIALDPPPSRVNYLGSQSATVTVTIVPRKSTQAFSNLRVEVIGSGRATVVPETVDVTVTGSPEVIQALREDQIVPRADLTKLPAGTLDQPHGSAIAPVTVELAHAEALVQPPTVTVKW